jgi:hypothetical protein
VVMFTHTVLHADETPVQMLDPGAGKTKRAYLKAAKQTIGYDFGLIELQRIAQT